MPYTMLNQEPLEEIFTECERRGMPNIIGSPYSSWILASGFRKESKYGYAAVSDEIRKKVQSIEMICEDHGIPLKVATLKFPQAHPQVLSFIPGSLIAAQVNKNLEMVKIHIPLEFWLELKQTGLLNPEALVA